MSDLAQLLKIGQPHAPAATAEDIYYCFRLLLSRNPAPHEWPGHSAHAGSDLRSVVRSFLESPEFADRGPIGRDPAADVALTQASGFVLYTASHDLAVGRHVAAGVYEPHVAALLRSRLRPGMGVMDVGANIGFFTMLAASLTGPDGCVLAVEPNPANVRMIEASRRANGFGHVTIAACAAGAGNGILALTTSYSNGATGPLGDALKDLMAAQVVPCFPLSTLWPADRRLDFIKIDVEGSEHAALAAARDLIRRWRPLIASEFSPRLLHASSGVSGETYLELLAGLGYRLFVVDGRDPPPESTVAGVMQACERSGGDHVDILLAP